MKENMLDIYGSNVFSESVMQELLPKKAYDAIKKSIETGDPLKPEVADIVASCIKDWAVEKGATHYCHWFQPMTEVTAEKHDAFLSPDKDGKGIIEFSGKQLIKGEPDASSLPSGGLRATFEARGYTAWDVSSPIFIKNNGEITSLYIPSAFCSQNGEILDKKTPLLRSMDALNKQALRILKLLGDNRTKKVIANLGAEQEYFLVPLELAQKRLDLKICGRTLFGELAAKGQELDDHYFGALKEDVANFMNDVNIELWKLGVSAKTFHNETAPSQYEIAPLYNTVNIATDQNQLIMETLQKVARDHGFMCLLHEKPFEGINGSGKHNNYSLSTNLNENLFNPGAKPKENLKFLLFICAMVRGVDKYQGLLRSSAATAGNDHRLGGHEAPPGILSIFLGEDISDALKSHTENPGNFIEGNNTLNLGTAIHNLKKDTCDRNRTSPMAFTGNKFEFRMVGSAQSTSGANFMLNTILAEILLEFAKILEKSEDKNTGIIKIIRMVMKENGKILFNGDNYSKEWEEEAKKRGLLNIKDTPEALTYLIKEESCKLFEKHNVLTKEEQEARYDIYMNRYANAIIIEGITMEKMLSRYIIPSTTSYAGDLAYNISNIKNAGFVPPKSAENKVNIITNLIDNLNTKCEELGDLIVKAKKIEDSAKKAFFVNKEILPLMKDARIDCDTIETLIDISYWPIPTYTDLIFNS